MNKIFKSTHEKFGGENITASLYVKDAYEVELIFSYYDCRDDCEIGFCECVYVEYYTPTDIYVNISPRSITFHVGESDTYSPSAIEMYCLDRVLNHFGLYSAWSYSAIIEKWYDTHEFHGMEHNMSYEKEKHFVKACCQVVDLDSDIEKIKYILTLEDISVESINDSDIVSIENIHLNDLNIQFSEKDKLDSNYIADIRKLNAIAVIDGSGNIIDGNQRIYEALRIMDEDDSQTTFPMVVVRNK